MVCGPGYEAMFTSSSMVDYKPRVAPAWDNKHDCDMCRDSCRVSCARIF